MSCGIEDLVVDCLLKVGLPVMAPSFWLVMSMMMPLLVPSLIIGYHFSSTWYVYSNASALLYDNTTCDPPTSNDIDTYNVNNACVAQCRADGGQRTVC
jgi:hypothetical protein